MVMGIPFSRMIETIGHDGSEILYPQFDSPKCRRGFHPQECNAAAYRLGYNFGFYDATAYTVPEEGLYHTTNLAPTLEMLIHEYTGVLGVTTKKGYGHAVAWDGKDVYDPVLAVRFPISRYEIVMFCPFLSRVESRPLSKEKF